MLICCNRGQGFLIFLATRAKLLTPGWSSGESTRSRLAEHASSIFRWFLHFKVISSSLEFNRLSRVVCTTNAWKSRAAAPERKLINVKFSCLLQQQQIICVKAKNLDRIDICLVEKLKSVMANKCFHLSTSSFNE